MNRKLLYSVPLIVTGMVLAFNLTNSLGAVPERLSTQQNWEYKTETTSARNIEKTLNESLDRGYKLVSIHYLGKASSTLIVFQAPKM